MNGGGWLMMNDEPEKQIQKESKPPYCVPSMPEISAISWNGYTVASTFSGCGGSCLGYRMAGFKVVWANEFVPAAQASYRANMADGCILDGRDIKTVKPEEILEVTGLKKGELDIFDGSPPCQAFSTAGKREKGWGKKKTYEHGASQCNETLFSEYIRLLRGLQPRAFVAENVSGLIKGTAKGYFLEILRDLKACGYRVGVRVLDAQWLGVPQKRQRVIFIGVRDDIDREPAHPKPLSYQYTVRDAIPWIGKVIYQDGYGKDDEDITNRPARAARAARAATMFSESSPQLRMGAHEFKPETMIDLDKSPCPTIAATGLGSYDYEIMKLPPSRLKKGAFNLQQVHPNEPCSTVTIASPENDLAVPHGTEKRKFTIAELKRICAFPDDFVLTGSYAQQWERLGNSVPPLMMKAIAETIRDKILKEVDE